METLPTMFLLQGVIQRGSERHCQCRAGQSGQRFPTPPAWVQSGNGAPGEGTEERFGAGTSAAGEGTAEEGWADDLGFGLLEAQAGEAVGVSGPKSEPDLVRRVAPLAAQASSLDATESGELSLQACFHDVLQRFWDRRHTGVCHTCMVPADSLRLPYQSFLLFFRAPFLFTDAPNFHQHRFLEKNRRTDLQPAHHFSQKNVHSPRHTHQNLTHQLQKDGHTPAEPPADSVAEVAQLPDSFPPTTPCSAPTTTTYSDADSLSDPEAAEMDRESSLEASPVSRGKGEPGQESAASSTIPPEDASGHAWSL